MPVASTAEGAVWSALGDLGRPAPSAPAAIPDETVTPDDLLQLRALLLGPEQRELVEVQRTVQRLEQGQTRLHAKAMAEMLPDAFSASHETEARRLASALAPAVGQSLGAAVRQNPEPVVEAVFPIIGPAIRRAVAEAMDGMSASVNRTIETRLSAQALAWRVEAWRTGRPYGEIVLSHTLAYRVEHAFLIDRASGLPRAHVRHSALDNGVDGPDPELFSGMLSAIGDFVRDSLGAEGTLGRLQVGERAVWIEAGPLASLALVVRGSAPADLRVAMQETLEALHQQFAAALAAPPETGPVDAAVPVLSAVVTEDYAPQRRNPARLIALGAAGALLLLAAWGIYRAIDAAQWRRLVARMDALPGVVVTGTSRDGGGTLLRGAWRVDGLRDPLGPDPADVLRGSRFADVPVRYALTPFVALDPSVVATRARRILAAPATARFAVRPGGVLEVSGSASRAWRDQAVARLPFVPGIERLDLRPLDAPERARLDAIAAYVARQPLYFAPALTVPADPAAFAALTDSVAAAASLARGLRLALSADIVAYASPEGTEAQNLAVSVARARGVQAILEARGVTVGSADGRGTDDGTTGSAPERLRRAELRLVVGR